MLLRQQSRKNAGKNRDYYQEHRDTIRPEEPGVVPAKENEYGYQVYFCDDGGIGSGPYHFHHPSGSSSYIPGPGFNSMVNGKEGKGYIPISTRSKPVKNMEQKQSTGEVSSLHMEVGIHRTIPAFTRNHRNLRKKGFTISHNEPRVSPCPIPGLSLHQPLYTLTILLNIDFIGIDRKHSVIGCNGIVIKAETAKRDAPTVTCPGVLWADFNYCIVTSGGLGKFILL